MTDDERITDEMVKMAAQAIADRSNNGPADGFDMIGAVLEAVLPPLLKRLEAAEAEVSDLQGHYDALNREVEAAISELAALRNRIRTATRIARGTDTTEGTDHG